MNERTRASKKIGLPPGSLVHVGERPERPVTIRLFEYGEGGLREGSFGRFEDAVAAFGDAPAVRWLDLNGVHDSEMLDALGKHFGLHPLLVEDLAHTGQRAKLELEENKLFLVMRRYRFSKGKLRSQQISFILGEGLMLTFRERKPDPFEPVLKRLRDGKGRMRSRKADYLFYALFDSIIDEYFAVEEYVSDRLEVQEQRVFERPDESVYGELASLRRYLSRFRKGMSPLRDISTRLTREEIVQINPTTRRYLADVQDHLSAIYETAEMQRENLLGLTEAYMNAVSNRMNETMRLLTVIATIFIPLTFLAGVYGMNFTHMPELDWPWAYPALMALMLLIGAIMLYFFRRQRWL